MVRYRDHSGNGEGRIEIVMAHRSFSGSGSIPLKAEEPRDRTMPYFLTLIQDPTFFSNVAALRKERQRLETILNLCAEYNKGDTPGAGVDSARLGFPSMAPPVEGGMRRPSVDTVGSVSLRGPQRQRESDEENLKEECSSTESTQQEHEDSGSDRQQELAFLEEERVRVLTRVDELKNRITELEQQLQESKQEVEMERALLQGERQAELEQVEAETEAIAQLQRKLSELESRIQREKDK
ncbi:hypothetical protein JZ751_002291, partial [Albula glossodonta]